MNSPRGLGVSPAATSTPTGVFSQRFEALLPRAGALGCVVPFAPPPFLLIYLCANVGLRGLLAVTPLARLSYSPPRLCVPPPCCESSHPLARLLPSAPPTGLDECFFFISFVIGLPYSLIFCQFWLFFVFKLLLSFFWLCEEAQCVYLHLHLGRQSKFSLFLVCFYKLPNKSGQLRKFNSTKGKLILSELQSILFPDYNNIIDSCKDMSHFNFGSLTVSGPFPINLVGSLFRSHCQGRKKEDSHFVCFLCTFS